MTGLNAPRSVVWILLHALSPALLAAQPSPLRLGEPLDRTFTAVEEHTFSLSVASGDYARVEVVQDTAEVAVQLRAPDGSELLRVDSPLEQLRIERVSWISDAGGVYTLAVVPRPGLRRSPGRYRIEATALRPATSEDRLRTEAEQLTAQAQGKADRALPGALEEVLTGFRSALEIRRQLGETGEEAGLDFRIGLAQLLSGRFADARASFAQALAIDRDLGDERAEAVVLNQDGRAARLLGESQAALASFQTSIEIWERLGEPGPAGSVISNLARLHLDRGDLAAAQAAFLQARERFREDDLTAGEILADLGLGGVLDQTGHPTEALAAFEEALALARELGHSNLEADALASIGNLYRRLGQPFRALDHLVPAAEAYRRAGNGAGEGVAQANLGSLLLELGETASGRERLLAALPLLRDPRDAARTRLSLSRAAREDGAPEEAASQIDQALAAQRAIGDGVGEGYSLRARGFLELDRGQPQVARETLLQALAAFERAGILPGKAEILRGLGQAAVDLGDVAAAETPLSQALALARQLGDTAEEARVLQEMARAAQAQGNLAAARAHLEGSLDVLESLRAEIAGDQFRTAYFAAHRKAYEMQVDVLLALHRQSSAAGLDGLAFEAAEKARARGMLDFLQRAGVEVREGDAGLMRDEQRLRLELNARAALRAQKLARPDGAAEAAALAKEIDRLTAEYQIVEARLEAGSGRYARLRRPEMGLAALRQESLDADTVLLEYFLVEPRSYLWAVTPDALASFELPGRAQIEALALQAHGLLADPAPLEADRERQDLRELSRILLGPALDWLGDRLGDRRLAVVPDGALFYVPFAALPVPAADGRGEVPLIVRREVVQLPSAAVLRELRRERAARPRPRAALAVFADPVFEAGDLRLRPDGKKVEQIAALDPPGRDLWEGLPGRSRQPGGGTVFARLPWTRREAELIEGEAAGREVLAALDFAASRPAAMAPALRDYRVLHFATHGVLDADRPALSGLLLSQFDEQGERRDGFLRLHDIYQLRLGADLVVLSGCDTARGKILRGEGLIGLTRGFFHAGAAQVLASLWPVRDRATAELMRRFYHALFQRGLPPSAALREAQVSLWREAAWRDAYYWGAFVLQGDWQAWQPAQ